MDAGDPLVQKMRAVAESAASHAYVPYSHLPVGAAVLVEGGETFSGCSVENASYYPTPLASIHKGHQVAY